MEKIVLAVVLALVATAERTPFLRFEPLRFFRRHFATDVTYLATGALALGMAIPSLALHAAQAFELRPLERSAIPSAVLFAVTIVLFDLGGYLSHLMLHRFDALWRLHKVHHSSRTLDWLATFRAHVLEHTLRHLLSPALLILLGFPPLAVAVASAVNAAWAALGHSNLRIDLRFLEPVFITPRLHRLHHVPGTSQQNLGTIFSFWDRLRGTLANDEALPLAPIGVPGEIESYPQGWIRQLVEPLRFTVFGAVAPGCG